MCIGKNALLVYVTMTLLSWSMGGCDNKKPPDENTAGNSAAGINDGKNNTITTGGADYQTHDSGAGGTTDQIPPSGAGGTTDQIPPSDAGGTTDQTPPSGAGGAVDQQTPTAGNGTGGSEPPSETPPDEQTTAGTDNPPLDPVSQETNCLQGSGDFTDAGPYEVTRRDVEVPGFGMYTLFYPANLEIDCPHPIVAWGNGKFVSGSEPYAHFNNHAASWGMVVIASHNSESISQPFLDRGIDWLLEQNLDPNSEFYQKLSTTAGAAGHSQGGRAATEATHHLNVVAAVSIQGGHTPAPDAALLCLTGVPDMARERCTEGYDTAQGPAFIAEHNDVDHYMPVFSPNDPGVIQYARLQTAWLRCFVAHDDAACRMFKDGCTLCSEPGWARIEGKNM